jgi:hypothetical protein
LELVQATAPSYRSSWKRGRLHNASIAPRASSTLALASESGAPISPPSERSTGSPMKLVARSKCAWRAAFARDELIAAHGADYPMPNLLDRLAAPNCPRLGSTWDRCGVHYVEPMEG